MTHKKINEYNIDLSSLGIVADEDAPLYFCTPKGARVIGWAGVDGIHYCFVRGFSDMVFAISPMNLPGNYVHPVARNFTDFLQLLLACGDAAALEQALCPFRTGTASLEGLFRGWFLGSPGTGTTRSRNPDTTAVQLGRASYQ